MTLICRRWLAAWLLVVLQTGCARDPLADLISRLGSSDVSVRRAAVRELGEHPIKQEQAAEALAKSLTDSDMEVRYLSAAALGKMGPSAKSSFAALAQALSDSEKRVRLESALAIAKIDPRDNGFRPVMIGAMREGDGRTLLAIGAMGENAAWAVPTLIGLLSHESPQVRVVAANTLGRIGPAAIGARSALEAAQRDSNPAVVTAVKTALKRIAAKPSAAGK